MQRSVTKNTKTMYNIREFGGIKLAFSLKMDKMLAFLVTGDIIRYLKTS